MIEEQSMLAGPEQRRETEPSVWEKRSKARSEEKMAPVGTSKIPSDGQDASTVSDCRPETARPGRHVFNFPVIRPVPEGGSPAPNECKQQ